MEFDYQSLKDWQREIRDGFPVSLALRTHRALSWLRRAEQEEDDGDARFLFLWIAFNAAYANEIHDHQLFTEQEKLHNFLKRLVDSDVDKQIYKVIWSEFPDSIRVLIDNQYVFKPFWDFHNGLIDQESWENAFDKNKRAASTALGKMDTTKVMGIIFGRLYVLRNQLIHGGSTWNSTVNRDQIRDGENIMGRLVPVIIYLMMKYPNQLWGDPIYPVVD